MARIGASSKMMHTAIRDMQTRFRLTPIKAQMEMRSPETYHEQDPAKQGQKPGMEAKVVQHALSLAHSSPVARDYGYRANED